MKNTVRVIWLAFCVSVEIWVGIVCLIFNHMPVANVLQKQIVPEWWHMLHPEREAFVFHGFVATAFALGAGFVYLFKRKQHFLHLKTHVILQTVFTALIVLAAFKTVIYSPRSGLAEGVIAIALIMSVINFIATPYISAKKFRFILPGLWPDILFGMGCVLILWIPHPDAVVARIFLGEQAHHYDSAIAAPAWAYLKGNILNIDTISQYGLGMPIFVGLLTKLFGGFSYISSMIVLVLGTLMYFCAWYVLLRVWFKDRILSMAAIIFAITTQIFHAGSYPIAFTYPSASVWRFIFDVVFFWALYMHITKAQLQYLLLAGVCVGFSIFHVTTTGMCLALTLGAYLVLAGIEHYKARNWPFLYHAIDALGLAALTFAFLLQICVGPAAFTAHFWQNMGEFNNYFLSGFGAEAIKTNFVNRHIYVGVLGYVIPGIYMTVILMGLGLTLFYRFSQKYWMAFLLSCYGLVLFHYYVGRAVEANLFVVALPCIFIVFYGLSLILDQRSKWIVFGLCLLCLFSNHNFIAYPNFLNISSHPVTDPLVLSPLPDGRSYFNHLYSQLPMDGRFPVNSLGEADEQIKTETDFKTDQQLAAYAHDEFGFTQDANLIDGLIAPGQKAPIISSFETQILIQANRAPFFYYTPIVISRLMRMRTFPVTALYTSGHLKRTIEQIQTQKPPYIFVERIFEPGMIAKVTHEDGSAFLALIKFVYSEYEPYKSGQFLMALKRR